MSTDDLDKLVDEALEKAICLRREIHRHPELADQEFETAKRVRKFLASTNVRLLPPFLGTDVVGLLDGSGPGRNVTLRADMDALPIREATDVPYCSATHGVMHACGHDGHTAMLAGTALVLNRLCDRFRGSVRFVFQPGEEVKASGRDLVAKGILRDPEPAASIALHAWPGRPAGSIGSCPGPAMAAAEFFSITIRGRGGHGCRPHDTIDPIVTAARVVDALQTVVSRNLDPLKPAVVSVCQLHAGTTANVIPETASIEGTIRYLEPHVGRDIIRHMQQLIKGVCDSTGATFEWQCDNAYIPTVNSEPVVNLGKRVTRMTLGEDAWFDVQVPSMGGEDFAFYLVDHPGALFRIGMGSASAPLHSPQFNFNDDAIRHGILFLATMALDVLNHGIDENS